MTTGKAKPRKRGRPALPEGEKKSNNLTFRARGDLRDRLADLAAKNDRSISEQVEFELTSALDQADLLGAITGRGAEAGFVEVLIRVAIDAGRFGGFFETQTVAGAENWLDNPYAFDQVALAVGEVLESFRPSGDSAPTRPVPLTLPLGIGLARGALEAIKNGERGGSIGDWAKPIRQKLGERANRIRVDDATVVVPSIRPSPDRHAAVAELSKNRRAAK